MKHTAALALAGSLLLHLAVAAVVLPALAARAPVQQTTQQSRLALTSVQVRRSRAQARAPASEVADRMQTSGAWVGSGGVPRTRAPAQAVTGLRRASETVEGEPLKALGSRGEAMEPAVTVAAPLAPAAPTTTVSQAPRPDTIRTTAAMAPASKAKGLTPSASVINAKLALSGSQSKVLEIQSVATLGAVGSRGETKMPVVTAAALLAPAAASASKGKTLTPEGPVIDAALAWSGSQTMALDSQSVATLAAFLQPGGTEGQQVRDRMASIMAALPCSRIHTVFDPLTGGLDVRGHVPDAAARAPLLAAMRAQVGGGLPLRDMLRILPEPQCGMLEGIAALGLPQSEEQLTDSDLVGENAQVREYAFFEGDRLTIDLTAPDYPAYVYVDYFDAMGQVIHLRPNAQSPLERMAADAVFSIGRGDDVDLRIAPPFGQDIAVAFAASVPLYDGLRPLVEPAGPYLEILRARIAAQRKAHPDFRGEWVYLFVATRQSRAVE